MKAHQAILLTLAIQACSNEGDDLEVVAEIPGTWNDRGIYCAKEIEYATFDLTNLPIGIESHIAGHLDREYGAPFASESLDVSEITFVGIYSACNSKVKIWEYPCGHSNNCYVGIQPWKDTYLTGMVFPEFDLK